MKNYTKYFLDSEFIETGETIHLISIGLVCDDGREYYAEVDEVPWELADPWVIENVRPHLDGYPVLSKSKIASEIQTFVAKGKTNPSFYGFYADFDWVVTCRLFGGFLNLPNTWPQFCMDLKQMAMDLGNPKLPTQTSTEHNALMDARWNKEAYEFLMELREKND